MKLRLDQLVIQQGKLADQQKGMTVAAGTRALTALVVGPRGRVA